VRRGRRRAEDSPVVRQLRELYASGMAELEERGEISAEERRRIENMPSDRRLRELYECGMAEFQQREVEK
jgi:hypothetical protein